MDEKRHYCIGPTRRPSNTSDFEKNTNTSESSNVDNEPFDFKSFESLTNDNNLGLLADDLAQFNFNDKPLLQNMNQQNILMKLVNEHLPAANSTVNLFPQQQAQKCCNYRGSSNPPPFRKSVESSSDESLVTPNSLSGESIGPVRRSSNSRLIPAYVWAGELPQRNYVHPVFSCKVFVGGVPWDITESALIEAFCPYGVCRVEWPGRENRKQFPYRGGGGPQRTKASGYVYIIFEQDRSVKALLHDCNPLGSAGEWYFKIKAKRNETVEIRQVQIIPWVISDSSYVYDSGCRLDIKKTVFVGALHGMITAPVLYNIMEELYGHVVFVGIDTDKHKYPIGSGRVTFSNHNSYFRAIESAFLEIRTSKFCKRVQIDPFLEDSQCMVCSTVPGPLFCRDRSCFRYFCNTCWDAFHLPRADLRAHRPLVRSTPKSTRRDDFQPSLRNYDWSDQDVGTDAILPSYHRQTGLDLSPTPSPLNNQTSFMFPPVSHLQRAYRTNHNNNNIMPSRNPRTLF